ncbi:MAG: RlmE family RNA methyltransferase [Spirochaetia bacterium]
MRNKPDHYTDKAKKEGYPARSVYKLDEIQNKQQIFRKGQTILDLGAAPGSWSLYIARKTQCKCRIIAVDLKKLNLNKTHSCLHFHQGDFLSSEIQAQLKEQGPFDAVISDAAPATTGNRMVDTGRSFSLAEEVISIAEELLKPGGNFVCKVFQGGHEKELMDRLRLGYKKVKAIKPKACRKDSFETFLIALDKKT